MKTVLLVAGVIATIAGCVNHQEDDTNLTNHKSTMMTAQTQAIDYANDMAIESRTKERS